MLVCWFVCLLVCLFVWVCLFVCFLLVCLFFVCFLLFCLFACLFACWFVGLFVCLLVCLFAYSLIRFLKEMLENLIEKKIQFKNDFGEITKATAASEMEIVADGVFLCKTSLDLAMMFRVKWWPEVAEEWKARTRNWPEKQIIEDVTKHSYIIAKPSDEEKSNIISDELSYSFHAVEAYLAQQRTPTQRFVYLIFKALVYKYLKPLNTDKIPSFWGKNVMLWATEKYPPENVLWKDPLKGVEELLNELLKATTHKQLDYFFIPSVNLMEGLKNDEQLHDDICLKLNSILKSFHTHIQRLDVCEAIIFYQEMLDECVKIPAFFTGLQGTSNVDSLLQRLRKRLFIYFN